MIPRRMARIDGESGMMPVDPRVIQTDLLPGRGNNGSAQEFFILLFRFLALITKGQRKSGGNLTDCEQPVEAVRRSRFRLHGSPYSRAGQNKGPVQSDISAVPAISAELEPR